MPSNGVRSKGRQIKRPSANWQAFVMSSMPKAASRSSPRRPRVHAACVRPTVLTRSC